MRTRAGRPRCALYARCVHAKHPARRVSRASASGCALRVVDALTVLRTQPTGLVVECRITAVAVASLTSMPQEHTPRACMPFRMLPQVPQRTATDEAWNCFSALRCAQREATLLFIHSLQ